MALSLLHTLLKTLNDFDLYFFKPAVAVTKKNRLSLCFILTTICNVLHVYFVFKDDFTWRRQIIFWCYLCRILMLHRSFVKKCLCLAKSSKKLPWREIQDTEKSAREIFINAFLNVTGKKFNFWCTRKGTPGFRNKSEV